MPRLEGMLRQQSERAFVIFALGLDGRKAFDQPVIVRLLPERSFENLPRGHDLAGARPQPRHQQSGGQMIRALGRRAGEQFQSFFSAPGFERRHSQVTQGGEVMRVGGDGLAPGCLRLLTARAGVKDVAQQRGGVGVSRLDGENPVEDLD